MFLVSSHQVLQFLLEFNEYSERSHSIADKLHNSPQDYLLSCKTIGNDSN